MPLKKKVAIHKYEGEYESPDGDVYDVTVVQHGDRCYIQWQLQSETEKNENPLTTIDGAFLEGIHEWYLDLTGKKQKPVAAKMVSSGRPSRGLRRPSVTDHRTAQGPAIHSQVKESMKNYDSDVKPVESFSPPAGKHVWDGEEGTAEMRAGIDPMAAVEAAPETPDQWRLDEEGPQWKKDAKERKNLPRPQYTAKGSAGERVRRVSAGDII